MKKSLKTTLALVCAIALVGGSALAASAITTRTLEAQYPGITVKVAGQTIALTDSNGEATEAFVVDSTTYVPIRSLGEAMGKRVEWDGETNTVSVGKAPMLEDAEELVAIIEGTHPAFALNRIPQGYETAKTALLTQAAQEGCTLAQFCWAAMAYTAALGDGHTAVNAFGNAPQSALDLDWVADGEHLWLTDETGAVTATEVKTIGGLTVAEVFAAIDRYFPAENVAGRDRNHTYWAANLNVLAGIGANLGGDYSQAAVVVTDGKTEESRTVAFTLPTAASGPEAVITSEMLGDVFYIDLNQCVLGTQVDAVAAELRQAVKDGTGKVIIDVRGNGGGSSAACVQLLQAMDMEPPAYGAYLRFSPLAGQQRGYDKVEGGMDEAPDLAPAKQNPAVKLVVLTDEDTYSSATMLAVYVQDGKLGTVIGRASANAPSHYGDILSYALGNSGLTGSVSHIQWLRPDAAAAPDVLTPDVEVSVGGDSLEAALEFLKR